MADLPPGLTGYRAAVEDSQRKNALDLQNATGLLGLQSQLEMKPLQAAQLRLALENGLFNQQLKRQIMGGIGGAPSAGAQPAFGEGGISTPGGGQANMNTGQAIPPGAASPSSNMLGGLSGPAALMLLSGDTGMGALGKAMLEQGKPINVRPGGTVYIPGQGPQYTAPGTSGSQITYGPNGQPQMGILPGAIESQTALGATPLERVQNPDQTFSYIPKSRLAVAGGAPNGQPVAVPAPSPQQLPPQLQGRPQAELDAINAVRSGQVTSARVPAPQEQNSIGTIPSSAVTAGFGGAPKFGQNQEEQIRQAGLTGANVEAGKEFIKKQADNYEKLRDVPATLANMDRAKQLALTQARDFMGPFGESKLAITKFIRSNIPGMENLNTAGVTNAEQLQSTLFNQVMDNLKKMDASPSQYQQQVMQEAFGTLRTDPQSVPKIIDVFADILRNRVAIHNQTVKSAEERGTVFPYNINVDLPVPQRRAGDNSSSQVNDPLGIRGKR